ncbi:hypothetical protein RZS08_19040, partial [Arthrospira platensis SPKY1]|nr:hypothetical protein [Arthrospira platensis SPKY1]
MTSASMQHAAGALLGRGLAEQRIRLPVAHQPLRALAHARGDAGVATDHVEMACDGLREHRRSACRKARQHLQHRGQRELRVRIVLGALGRHRCRPAGEDVRAHSRTA